MSRETKKNGSNGKAEKALLVGDIGHRGDGRRFIDEKKPYRVSVSILGTADIILHRFPIDAVQAQADADKGSVTSKRDDVESYVYRCEDGTIGVPGSYLQSALCGKNGIAKSKKDPRSPRKGLQDLMKSSVLVSPDLASFGMAEWDYVDVRRAVVNGGGIARARPVMRKGWELTFEIDVLQPQYFPPEKLVEYITEAGQFNGLGDNRPYNGRFAVSHFEVLAA